MRKLIRIITTACLTSMAVCPGHLPPPPDHDGPWGPAAPAVPSSPPPTPAVTMGAPA